MCGLAQKPKGDVSRGNAEPLRLEASLDAMGSAYTIVAYGEDRARLEEAVDQAFEEIRRLDRMLSNYRRDSEWSVVNRVAGERPIEVTQELFDLLANCLEYSRLSEGAFDISVGPLMKVWGFYKGSGELPRKQEVAAAVERVGYRNIVLDSKARTVRFLKAGVEIDPGGIGKGYAVDLAAAVLKANGIRSALVSASGSSIYALGAPPEDAGWRIDIRDPKDETKTAAEVVLKDESLSTSGSYEKFFKANGKVYSHIMDPRTGYPAQGVLAVSVIAPKTLDSEAWTKPFFVNGRRWAAQHKPKEFRVFLCGDKALHTNQAGMEAQCAWLP